MKNPLLLNFAITTRTRTYVRNGPSLFTRPNIEQASLVGRRPPNKSKKRIELFYLSLFHDTIRMRERLKKIHNLASQRHVTALEM